MPDPVSNDNDAGVARGPDSHGQAALLLVESLIHVLVERSIITLADAVETVSVARDVKVEVADELGDSATTLQKSLDLLDAIHASLSYDMKDS